MKINKIKKLQKEFIDIKERMLELIEKLEKGRIMKIEVKNENKN